MALPSQLSGCRSESAGEFYTEWEESYESFDQMNLHENLLRGIYAYGEESGSAAFCSYFGCYQPLGWRLKASVACWRTCFSISSHRSLWLPRRQLSMVASVSP